MAVERPEQDGVDATFGMIGHDKGSGGKGADRLYAAAQTQGRACLR
jgi:hypothetical protein